MIGKIFNAFSRRKGSHSQPKKQLTEQFWQRTFMLIRDVGPGVVETLECGG